MYASLDISGSQLPTHMLGPLEALVGAGTGTCRVPTISVAITALWTPGGGGHTFCGRSYWPLAKSGRPAAPSCKKRKCFVYSKLGCLHHQRGLQGGAADLPDLSRGQHDTPRDVRSPGVPIALQSRQHYQEPIPGPLPLWIRKVS